MNNKIIFTKRISTIFLAIVLVAGTIVSISPSFMFGTAQAESYYNGVGMDDNYNNQYGKDNNEDNSYYKSKDSSSSNSVTLKKTNCNNINVNASGLELTALPSSLSRLLTDREAEDEGQYGSSSYYGSYDVDGGGGQQSGYGNNNNNSFKFVCINNNNNTIVEGEEPEPPIPTEPTTASLTVTKTTTCDPQEFGFFCNSDPQITVTGNNPNPGAFTVSQTPISVTLGAGEYSVDEQEFVQGLESCTALGFDGGQSVSGNIFVCTNFSEDCSGDIGVGEELTCNIENTVIETGPTATLLVTKLVTCDDENGENFPSCADLLATITEDQFNILVQDPTPSRFNGSEAGTLVTLSAGPYSVSETIDDSIRQDMVSLGGSVTGPIPSFTGDCTQIVAGVFSAAGTTAAGESQTCNIFNHFTIEEDDAAITVSSSPIIDQDKQDSLGLTALEKIEKLKQQWLELLP